MRTLVTIGVILTLLLPAGNVLAATGFSDVVDHWAEDEINYLQNLGIVSGLPSGDFGVSQGMTRAQVAQLLTNQGNLQDQVAPYPDVPMDHWANGAIGAVTAAGFMGGFPDGTFAPDAPLTRAQAAVVINNAFPQTNTNGSATFSDLSSDHWAFSAVTALADNYLIAGYPDGSFRPGQIVTRAEFAVLMARALDSSFTLPLELQSQTQTIIQLLNDEDMVAFSDYVHPIDGVRFSPYEYVESDHLVFSEATIPNLLADPTIYMWGTEDGTGDPIEKTAAEYFDRYVMRKEYLNPDQVVYNTIIPRGSLINNIEVFYPDAIFIEYHVEGTAQFGGLDWGSLFVVYELYQDDWYVVGLVNGEWTT